MRVIQVQAGVRVGGVSAPGVGHQIGEGAASRGDLNAIAGNGGGIVRAPESAPADGRRGPAQCDLAGPGRGGQAGQAGRRQPVQRQDCQVEAVKDADGQRLQ